LPEGWATALLGQIVSPSKEKVEPSDRPDAPYLSLEHIEPGTGRILGQGLASEVASTKAVFRAGDVLYGKLRPYLNKVCVPDFDGICSTDILVFPKSEFIESRYLLSFLMLGSVVEFANHNMSGVQLPRISFEKLAELRVPLAPLVEQKRIVAKVEGFTKRVNAARERLDKLLAILKRFRQSVLSAACSGQLTAEWRQLQSYTDGPVDSQPDLRELPSGWKWKALGQMGQDSQNPVQTGPFGAQLHRDEFVNEGVPVIAVGNLTGTGFTDKGLYYITPTKARQLARYTINAGDVLFARSGATLGKVCVAPPRVQDWRMTGHILRIRLDQQQLLPHFAVYALRGDPDVVNQVQFGIRGVTRPGYNTSLLESIRVPVPPLTEQREIVRRVEALFALADRIEEHVRAATVRADLLPQAILARAFRGELVPTEAQFATEEGRDYESASVLLQRNLETRKRNQAPDRGRGGKHMSKRNSGRPAKTRRPLDEVLREQGRPLTPERLFDLADFDEGSVDGFYEQLRKLIEEGKVRENRPNKKYVTLQAVGT
jgi:type I restriction enzyme, S subunit